MADGTGSVEVVAAGAADVLQMVDLFEAVAAEGRWIGREAPLDRAAATDQFQAMLARPEAGVFVARAGDRVVGEVHVERQPFGVADVGMMVDDAWRGRGVGGGLLAAAVDWARAHDAHKVALQVWPHNHAARALYRKFGFEDEGYLHRHYRRRNGELWDAVVMGLVLDDAASGGPPA